MTARERSLGFLLAVLLPCSLSFPAAAAEPFRLAADDVVVFMGSANMLHLQQAGYLETILTQSQPTGGTRFRDLSWEADTVFRQGSVIERWREGEDCEARETPNDPATAIDLAAMKRKAGNQYQCKSHTRDNIAKRRE